MLENRVLMSPVQFLNVGNLLPCIPVGCGAVRPVGRSVGHESSTLIKRWITHSDELS